MFKTYRLSALIAVSLSSVIGAWGQRSPMDQDAPPADIHFPLNDAQAWAVEESLLIWKTYEDDTDYAVHYFIRDPTDSSRISKSSIKHPEFEWSTGVRLKLTRYLPSSDPWDVNVIATYYYDQAEDGVKVNLVSDNLVDNFLVSTWSSISAGAAAKARATSQMNFFTFDLTAGRYFSLTRKIDIHPFIGIRTVLNYQDYKATFFGKIVSADEAPFAKARFKGGFDFWGVGPRIGADVALRMGRHWSLIGTFGASLFGGRYDIDERFAGHAFAVKEGTPFHEKLADEDNVLRSNIDVSLGLGWEKWVRGKTVRIAPSFVFEVSEWFSMKRWIDSSIFRSSFATTPDPIIYTHRRYSDLGLMGFNINLKVDF